MKPAATFLILTLVAPALPGLPPADGLDGFGGESWTGWTFDTESGADPAETWRPGTDGVLHVEAAGQPNSVLRSTGTYRDYVLEFEWRWPGKPGNSGLLIHAFTPGHLGIWPRCLEIQLMHGHAGDFVMLGETIEGPSTHYSPDRARFRRKFHDAEEPPGAWNRMRVTVRGHVVEVQINGQLVNVGWAGSASHGAIALQAEGADIEFRNLRLVPRGD